MYVFLGYVSSLFVIFIVAKKKRNLLNKKSRFLHVLCAYGKASLTYNLFFNKLFGDVSFSCIDCDEIQTSIELA